MQDMGCRADGADGGFGMQPQDADPGDGCGMQKQDAVTGCSSRTEEMECRIQGAGVGCRM